MKKALIILGVIVVLGFIVKIGLGLAVAYMEDYCIGHDGIRNQNGDYKCLSSDGKEISIE